MGEQQGEEAANRAKPYNNSVIVAMKGHPATGKSTLARAIAAHLRCPLLDKDDIYGACRHLHSSAGGGVINDLSYESLWSVSATQVGLGLSIVVDSPLSSRSRLQRLLQVASQHGASVLIVECMPGDQAEWRRRLERRGAEGGATWHKPATWQDMERLLDSYDGCYDYDTGGVAKLVVDTTAALRLDQVLDFIRSHSPDALNNL